MNEQKYKEMTEAQGQVLEEVVLRIESLENREYPDYRRTTVEINDAVALLLETATEAKTMVSSVPKSITTEHIHKLDFKSKKAIIIVATLVIVIFLCVTWIINLYDQKSQLSEFALKYRAIRQVYPRQGDWADSVYRVSPANMEQTTRKLEDQSLASSHAKDIAEQKYREAEEAKGQASKLEKASKRLRKDALHSK